MSGCGHCVPSRKTHYWMDWRLSVKEHIANIGIHLEIFVISLFANQLMCIMGELAGGGSVAVAVAISDTQHVTPPLPAPLKRLAP